LADELRQQALAVPLAISPGVSKKLQPAQLSVAGSLTTGVLRAAPFPMPHAVADV
jgi:hypothetical protein